MRFNRDAFWEKYRAKFGRVNQSQVDAIEFLLDQFERDKTWRNIKEVSYALATIKHETAHTFKPIYEKGGKSYFSKYDGRDDLGNKFAGDGYLYRGRGYVQLTGRTNYTKYGIANDPDKALEPLTAFRIMSDGMHKGVYTGKKLSDFISNSRADYRNARKVINGLDKAAQIAVYAEKFEDILSAAVASPDSKSTGVLPDFSEQNGTQVTPGDPAAQPPSTTADATSIPLAPEPAVPVQTVAAQPSAEKEPEPESALTKIGNKANAAYTALSGFGAGVIAWMSGASTEIIIGATATVISLGGLYMFLNYRRNENKATREQAQKVELERIAAEERQRREDRAHEMQMALINAAASKDKNTVALVPPPAEVPNSDPVES